MADNTTLNTGSGGDTIASDDIGGVKYPRSKIVIGADGTNDGDVSSANPLPVKGTGTAGTANSGVLTIQGIASMTPVQIADNSGSVTVDNSGTFVVQVDGAALTRLTDTETNTDSLAVVGNGAAATAQRVTLANDSTGIVSLTTSTASIGKLAANSGVDIGDVDVTSVIPGTSATSLGKAIDSVAGATDTGVSILAIRDDSLSTLTPAEGDWAPLRVNSTGALHVTGGGGGTQYAVDDVAGATDTGTLLLAIRDDSLSTLTPIDGDYVGLRVSSTGALHVTGGGGGTEYNEDAATPATITGTATMMERDDALSALTPIEGDWAAMRCSANGALWVSVDGSVTVASHAVTNAGTFAVQVDGAALTALQLIDDAIYAEDVAAQAADKGVAILAVRRDADTSLVGTDNDYANLQVDSNGYLKVEIFDGGGSHTVDNAGTFAVQVDGSALTALQLLDDTVFTDDAAFTPATSKVLSIGMQADESSTDSVDEGDIGCPRMTLDRKQLMVAQTHTAGGSLVYKTIDLDETEEEVKATAGQVYGYYVYNAASSVRYVKFYNATAANVIVGTTTPVLTLPIPATTAGHTNFPFGIVFDTAITIACTTGLADNDTGAPSANDLILMVYYK